MGRFTSKKLAVKVNNFTSSYMSGFWLYRDMINT